LGGNQWDLTNILRSGPTGEDEKDPKKRRSRIAQKNSGTHGKRCAVTSRGRESVLSSKRGCARQGKCVGAAATPGTFDKEHLVAEGDEVGVCESFSGSEASLLPKAGGTVNKSLSGRLEVRLHH